MYNQKSSFWKIHEKIDQSFQIWLIPFKNPQFFSKFWNQLFKNSPKTKYCPKILNKVPEFHKFKISYTKGPRLTVFPVPSPLVHYHLVADYREQYTEYNYSALEREWVEFIIIIHRSR